MQLSLTSTSPRPNKSIGSIPSIRVRESGTWIAWRRREPSALRTHPHPREAPPVPAVVNITAHAAEQQTLGPTPDAIDSDDPFFAFFKRVAPQSQESQGSPPRAMSGTGSGFIVSPDGLILTTAHVVDRADEVTVRLTDRREFKAQGLVVDAQSDVAVLQIDAPKLPTVKLGDSC